MKSITLVIICFLTFNSCKNKRQEIIENPVVKEKVTYATFGKKIINNDAIQASSMLAHYEVMNLGDSIDSKMIAQVKSVCQVKGCWMRLSLDSNNEVIVRFKNYAFFVPKDIIGKDVIINGKAFVKETSVDEQRHYAKDSGKSTKEVENIIEPKRTYSFLADGVLVVQ